MSAQNRPKTKAVPSFRLQTFITTPKIVLVLSAFASLTSWVYYSSTGANLSLGDAVSRLDIGRRVMDNLTPGFAQLGNVWLPLPQILMLPFIWSSTLWHTGVAGAILSMISFVLIVWYLYKIGEDIFRNKLSGIIMALIPVTNINLLFLQTTAMSELSFIAAVVVAIYYLLRWTNDENNSYLIVAALSVAAATLIRYEGYLFAISSIIYVLLIAALKKQDLRRIEGELLLFSTLAVQGILLWALYLWAIFGNPLYWIDIYSHKASLISNDVVTHVSVADQGSTISQKGHLWASISSYWQASAFMNGALLAAFGSLIIIILIVLAIRAVILRRNLYLIGLLLPLSLFVFVAFTVYRGSIPLDLPTLDWKAVTSANISAKSEYNIRYGILMLPMLAIAAGWLVSLRKVGKYFSIIVIAIISVQLFSITSKQYSLTYQLAAKARDTPYGLVKNEQHAAYWLKAHYDGGYILISALKHDPVMFYLGVDYKNYIHEGTGKYWLSARDNPDQIATWIYMYKTPSGALNSDDSVTKYLYHSKVLETKYRIVYEDAAVQIFKRN